jgi:hypothetical protein
MSEVVAGSEQKQAVKGDDDWTTIRVTVATSDRLYDLKRDRKRKSKEEVILEALDLLEASGNAPKTVGGNGNVNGVHSG